MSIPSILTKRSRLRDSYEQSSLNDHLYVNDSFIDRLSLENELEGHKGCVNCLEWSPDGILLASGSDDLTIRLWNPLHKKALTKLQSGHRSNIFSVKFLPHCSKNNIVGSAAADGQVRVHNLETSQTLSSYSCHSHRVKRLATSAVSPYMLWSAGEDGTVRVVDVRESHSCNSTADCHCNNICINLNGENINSCHNLLLECKCLDICPTKPYIAVGGSDQFVRLFDMRKLRNCNEDFLFTYGSGVNQFEPPAMYFVPGHITQSEFPVKQGGGGRVAPRLLTRSVSSTFVTFNDVGTELLVNVGSEQLYLFDVDNPHYHSFKYSFPQIKRSTIHKLKQFNQNYSISNQIPSSNHKKHNNGEEEIIIDSTGASSTVSVETNCNSNANAHINGAKCNNLVINNFSHTVNQNFKTLSSINCSTPILTFAPTAVGDQQQAATTHPTQNRLLQSYCHHYSPKLVDQWNSLKAKANDYFHNNNFMEAIACYSKLLQMTSYNSHIIYANRAFALMKRDWPGDVYAALIDLRNAVELDVNYVKAHLRLIKCLVELEWIEEAFDWSVMLKKYMTHSIGDDQYFKNLHEELTGLLEDKKSNKANKYSKPDWTSTSISNVFFSRTATVLTSQISGGGNSSQLTEEESNYRLKAVDFKSRFCGHCNTATDIKEANFFGTGQGQYIVAGSDDGSFFIWDKYTTNLLRVMIGDESIVNCLQPNPRTCMLATSGIDDTIKLWSPGKLDIENPHLRKNLSSVASSNQKRLNSDPMETFFSLHTYIPGRHFTSFVQANNSSDDDENTSNDEATMPDTCRAS